MSHQHVAPSPLPRRLLGVNLLLAGLALPPLALLVALLRGTLVPSPLHWSLVVLYLVGAGLLVRRIGLLIQRADRALVAYAAERLALSRRIGDLEHQLEAQQAELSTHDDVALILARQAAYNQALARCSQVLLRQDYAAVDLHTPLDEALDVLRQALGIDRLYIYQHSGPADNPTINAIVRSRPAQVTFQLFPQGLPLRMVAATVRAALERGEVVGGPVEQIITNGPDVLQALRTIGLYSVQIVPIHQDGRWWGSLVAGDLPLAHDLDAPESQLLRTTGEMIAAFVRSWDAARQLSEREEMLRAIGDNLPLGGIYRMLQNSDGSHTVQYVSAGIEQLYGVSPAQLYADASLFHQIWRPEQVAPGLERDRQALVGPDAFELEVRHLLNPDAPRWIYIRSTPTPLPDGGVRWDGVALDVTARRSAEEALRESREQLQQAIWAADLALWEWDARTRTTTISPEMPALLGYDPAEVGDPVVFWIEQVHPDDRAVIGRMITLSRSGDAEIFEAIYRMRHKDGTWHWMRSRGRTVARDPAGLPLRAIGITHDITQQKLAEQEIRAQRDFAQQVITLIGQGLAVLDPQSRITYINPSFSQILGYQPEEVIGQLTDLITPPSMIEQQTREYERRTRGETSTYELQLWHKDGSLVDLLVTAAPIVRDGSFQGTISVLTDIRDRKRTEEELRSAKEAAEAADRAKSRFLAHMSHEIRTPLNAVIGMSSLLQETPLTADQQELIATIRTGGETLLDIINNILDLSKIESGQLSLADQPYDLQLCVEEALNLVALQAAQKRISLQVHIDPDVPTMVLGDELRLRQVLVNLLANAVKFTDQGGVTLRVIKKDACGEARGESAQADADHILHPESGILFAVHDTGVGIPPDQLGRIFEPFTQVEVEAAERVGGTGLGLAISRQLADAMGGSLQATSVPGQGSTFTLTLPLRAAPTDATVAGHRPALVGRQVLLVAAPGPERERLALMCRGWGMHPLSIDTGQEVLDQLDDGLSFDIAVIALDVPDQISQLTARLLEEHHAWARRPLVLVTEQPQPALVDGEIAHGQLSRPVRRARFADALAHGLTATDPALRIKLRTLRVLLAEDNLVNQQVTVRLLRQLQIEVDLATDGLQALQAVQHHAYDLVLMDAQMPVMDGLQATQQIRALGDTITQPYIVALTALAMINDRERFLAAGVNDYLSKPVQMDDLRAALGRLRGWTAPRPAEPVRAPAADLASQAVIDWEILDQLSQALGVEGEETVLQLIGLFRSEINHQIDRLDAAIRQADLPQAAQVAHRLFGSSRQMGAVQMAGLSFAIEQAALREDHASLPQLMSALRAAYAQATEELGRRYAVRG